MQQESSSSQTNSETDLLMRKIVKKAHYDAKRYKPSTSCTSFSSAPEKVITLSSARPTQTRTAFSNAEDTLLIYIISSDKKLYQTIGNSSCSQNSDMQQESSSSQTNSETDSLMKKIVKKAHYDAKRYKPSTSCTSFSSAPEKVITLSSARPTQTRTAFSNAEDTLLIYTISSDKKLYQTIGNSSCSQNSDMQQESSSSQTNSETDLLMEKIVKKAHYDAKRYKPSTSCTSFSSAPEKVITLSSARPTQTRTAFSNAEDTLLIYTISSDKKLYQTIVNSSENLVWENLCGCCTNGAPAMLGTRSGFQIQVKEPSPKVRGIHCMIHRQALASKTLPANLGTVLDQVVKIVNFVKGGALNSRLFKQLCADMDATHQTLLFHTNVRWLSKGNVTARVFALRDELKLFYEAQERSKNELDLLRNPFKLAVEIVPDDCQDEFLELKNDSGAKDLFDEKSVSEFWPLMCESYPKIAEIAIRALLPFVSTYLCESGFSTMLQIKTKQRTVSREHSRKLYTTLECVRAPPRRKDLETVQARRKYARRESEQDSARHAYTRAFWKLPDYSSITLHRYI
ncbi:unnamed protein product [Phaedon cochleariae]|uniref:Uncharacterized protein n=1 Tax=Phaedon cochleariae TaxID=80249 RepID=A0A9N9SHM2_PHACE|nr:unnamed protein product [Phaedon cochleariae]